MSNTHEIKIINGYSNGELKLRPKKTFAKNKEYIRWTINSDDVFSIESIDKKSGTDIFKIFPHRDGNSTDWIAELKDNLPKDSEWEYSITWNGKTGLMVFDPIISVNPTL